MPLPPTGIVTFLFAGVDDDAQARDQAPQAVLRGLERHGCKVVKTTAGGVYAAFTHISAALAAAVAIQQLLAEELGAEGEAPALRVALHTGVAELRAGDYHGPVREQAAQLFAAAHCGQILLSQTTRDLALDHLPPDTSLRDLGEYMWSSRGHSEHVFQLLVPGQASDFPPLRIGGSRQSGLPAQPTSFIGRERELATVCALLRRADVRLITLSGPAGIGKTRLALQAATELSGELADGARFVSLATVEDPRRVAAVIAQTLAIREGAHAPVEYLRRYLLGRQLLLVLDNFESIITAAPELLDLLASAPQLKLLVTSRERLRLSGEHELAIPPLALPGTSVAREPAQAQLTALAASPAVALFIERAQAINPELTLSARNAAAIVEICKRLDGLPLAIELAAARAKHLSPQAILARLSSRLTALSAGPQHLPPRQQTLRQALDWSYHLLDPGERQLFARLAVFVGGFSLEAAEQMLSRLPATPLDAADHQDPAGGQGPPQQQASQLEVPHGVMSLLDKSLLRQEAGAEARLAMLETIREYALERLAQSGAEELIRQAHAAYYLALARRAEPELHHAEQESIAWLRRLELEHANMRAALSWLLARGEQQQALLLATALYKFWLIRGHISEGQQWLEAGLAHEPASGSAEQLQLRARALVCAAMLARERADYDQALAYYRETMALSRRLDDSSGIAAALNGMGVIARWQGLHEQAAAYFEESLALRRTLDDQPGIASSLSSLGRTALLRHRYEQARDYFAESLALYRSLGDRWAAVDLLVNLGNVWMHQGEYQRATELFLEGLALHQQLGDRTDIAYDLEVLGVVACKERQPLRAARLFAAAEALREEVSAPLPPALREEYAPVVAAIRAQLGATYEAAWQEGRALPLAQVIRYARDNSLPQPDHEPNGRTR